MLDFDNDGYPTEGSLQRLRELMTDRSANIHDQVRAAYDSLESCIECVLYAGGGPDDVDVRGEVLPVFAFHTGGWSGNEDVIDAVLSCGAFRHRLQREDRGGHYYFQPKEET